MPGEWGSTDWCSTHQEPNLDSPAESLLSRHPLPAPTSNFPRTSPTRSGDSFSMTLDFWSLELVRKSGHAEEWRV